MRGVGIGIVLSLLGCGGALAGDQSAGGGSHSVAADGGASHQADAAPLPLVIEDASSGQPSVDSSTTECTSAASGDEIVIGKSFLTAPIGPWSGHATVVSATPNVESLMEEEWSVSGLSFVVNSQELQLRLAMSSTNGLLDEVLDSWPVTNVDVSGECVVNGAGDWQYRPSIVWSFEKSDASELGLFPGGSKVSECVSSTGAQTALVPGSFVADEAAGTMAWSVAIDAPLTCTGLSDASASDLHVVVAFSFTR